VNLDGLKAALADRYTIERELGAGGMATVFLAEDVKHHRQVAIKVLRPELAAVIGAERFLAEIRTTANLQHPHILPLHDSGNVDGTLFYVMPFIEGVSLRDRLNREHQLPIEDAVRIASEVADALQYAHEHGIIHRDVKPENILLQGGHALVADFGIALAASKAGTRMTETGMSLGTPQYMSPEQAMGERELDARSDVYALGCVTFEMLTGEPPFTGPTAQAIVAKVMTTEPPDVTSLRKTVPPAVAEAVHAAMQKLPADRFASARQFAEALRGHVTIVTPRSAARHRAAAMAAPARGNRFTDPLFLAAVLVAVGALGWIALRRAPARGEQPVTFVASSHGAPQPVYTVTWPAAISPDGRSLVYAGAVGNGSYQLFLRRVDGLEARALPGTAGATQPVFSPDGKSIAFESGDGKLERLALDGGMPVALAPYTAQDGAAWSPGGEIVLGAGASSLGLTRVPENGGTPIPLTSPDTTRGGTVWHVWPIILADGKTVLFAIWNAVGSSGSELAMTSLDDGVVHRLGVRAMRPLGMIGDVLVYLTADGAVMATRYDLRHQREVGGTIAVLDSIPMCAQCNGDGAANLSAGGSLAYMRGAVRSRMVWVSRNGVEQPAMADSAAMLTPRLSPDGTRIAMEIDALGRRDIWIYDIATRTLNRLTNSGANTDPEWSGNGRFVEYVSVSDTITQLLRQPADFSGGTDTVLSVGGAMLWLADPSSTDSEHVVSALPMTTGTPGRTQLFAMKQGARELPAPYLSGAFGVYAPRLSPNGRLVAYISDETGRFEVYVQSFPVPGARIQVSNHGGTDPVWSPDGRHLFYVAGSTLTVAGLSAEPAVAVVSRDTLFSGPYFGWYFNAANYDVSRDGTKLLMLRPVQERLDLVVALDWIDSIKTRLGEK
jgi:eukaryotic-like serine/threonine-protein kinase